MPGRCATTIACHQCRSSRSACRSSSSGLQGARQAALLRAMPADVRSHRFISHFPAAQGAKLAKQVKLVRFPHAAVIFDEGSASDCIYLVLTGRVALTKKSPGGAPQIIAYKGPDDYFGELGVLDGSTRSTAAL